MSETKASRKREEKASPDDLLRTATQAAPAVVLLSALGAGIFLGAGYAILILTAGTLIGAIAGFWSSIRALFGETELSTEDAFALGAPSAEEEQKRAVLRAIKDLEFEHGVGKISDYDYRVLMAGYRQQARKLLQQIDDTQQPDRDRAEKLVDDFLAEQGIEPAYKDMDDASPSAEEPKSNDEDDDENEDENENENENESEDEDEDEDEDENASEVRV